MCTSCSAATRPSTGTVRCYPSAAAPSDATCRRRPVACHVAPGAADLDEDTLELSWQVKFDGDCPFPFLPPAPSPAVSAPLRFPPLPSRFGSPAMLPAPSRTFAPLPCNPAPATPHRRAMGEHLRPREGLGREPARAAARSQAEGIHDRHATANAQHAACWSLNGPESQTIRWSSLPSTTHPAVRLSCRCTPYVCTLLSSFRCYGQPRPALPCPALP